MTQRLTFKQGELVVGEKTIAMCDVEIDYEFKPTFEEKAELTRLAIRLGVDGAIDGWTALDLMRIGVFEVSSSSGKRDEDGWSYVDYSKTYLVKSKAYKRWLRTGETLGV